MSEGKSKPMRAHLMTDFRANRDKTPGPDRACVSAVGLGVNPGDAFVDVILSYQWLLQQNNGGC